MMLSMAVAIACGYESYQSSSLWRTGEVIVGGIARESRGTLATTGRGSGKFGIA